MSPDVITRPVPYRAASSLGIVVSLAGAALYYLMRDPTPGRPANVVAYLDSVGPFWPSLFGGAAVLLLAALVAGRWRAAALLVAAGVFAAYAFALLFAAVVGGAGWATACLAAGLAMQAVGLSASYPEG